MGVVIQRTVGLRPHETIIRWDLLVPAHIPTVSLQQLVGRLLLLPKMLHHSLFIFSVKCGLANTGLHISTSLQPWSTEKNSRDISALNWLAGPYGPPKPYGAVDHACGYINLIESLFCVREPWKTRQITLQPPPKQVANKK